MYGRHYTELCRYARPYLEAWDDTEDVVQEVFRRILEHPDRASRIDAAYLHRVVRNEALHRVRRKRIRLERQEAVRWISRPVTTPAQDLHRKMSATAVSLALDSLPPRCRETILLTTVDGLTYAEAAACMGITRETVKAQIRRARRLLRDRLAEHGPGE